MSNKCHHVAAGLKAIALFSFCVIFFQVEKREKFSRRRMHDPDADVDYINERNKNFNKKLERFYNGYTKDIRDNLERGTAV